MDDAPPSRIDWRPAILPMIRKTTFAILSLLPFSTLLAETKAPADSERIVLIGNGLGERMIDHPYLETNLQLSFPGANLYIRNLCRPGDTPGFRPHPSRKSQWAFPGAEKFHPHHKIHAGEGFHPTPDEWLAELKPDTLIAFFGYNESFDGPSGVENYKKELEAWIRHTLGQKYNGRTAPRLVLVSPIAYEDLSKSRDLPEWTGGKRQSRPLHPGDVGDRRRERGRVRQCL